MNKKNELSNVQIFSYMDDGSINLLSDIFVHQKRKKGELLIHYRHAVPGIFILTEGEVVVLGPDKKTPLAFLKKGASVGEMSFLIENTLASAYIVVSSKKADILFCETDLFLKNVIYNPPLAQSFYKGAAVLIADRLRRTSVQITEGYQFVAGVMGKAEVDYKLLATRSMLNKTGSNIISQLLEVLPLLDKIIDDYPEMDKPLLDIKGKIESVAFTEGQNFDKFGQQLDHILQHFANLKCIVNGGPPREIKGDDSLFDSEAKTETLFF